jgi:hypothetical protein
MTPIKFKILFLVFDFSLFINMQKLYIKLAVMIIMLKHKPSESMTFYHIIVS